MRDVTERPGVVQAGWAELVGTYENLIIEGHYKKMQMVINPYGDGKASSHICNALIKLPKK